MIIGLITTILGILGIAGIFTDNLVLIIVGGCANLVEVAIGLFTGQLKSLFTTIIFSVGGFIASSVFSFPWWQGIFMGLCFESVVMGVLGLILFLFVSRKTQTEDYLCRRSDVSERR